jgi:hypothetical protein
MQFKYKITLELEVLFEAPLLGVDTTERKRKIADSIAKKALQEANNIKSTHVSIDREIDEDNLKGTIKVNKQLNTNK